MNDASSSTSLTSWREEVHVFLVNLPPVELHIRDPRTGERQRELFVFHAFNNVQDPNKMERCKTAVTHFFKTTAWREQIQTGEEDCLQVLVIQHGLKKLVCAYCHKEHTQIDAALSCIHGHLDYKPFLCGHAGKKCKPAKLQALVGCGARFAGLHLLKGHCR